MGRGAARPEGRRGETACPRAGRRQADQREALLDYRQQVLLATEEVESALVQVRRGQIRMVALQERARHAVEEGSVVAGVASALAGC